MFNIKIFIYFITLHFSTKSSSSAGNLPLVINTWEFIEAANVAFQKIINQPASALDALVSGCAECERSQCGGTVGYGGSPDENGETTLDAFIMDGSNMNIGAVAGLRDIKDAIKVARHVLEKTEHSFLVGESASDFAEMMGFAKEPLSTKESTRMWSDWKNDNCQPNFWINVKPNPKENCGPYAPIDLSEVKTKENWKHENCQFNFFNDVVEGKSSAKHFHKTEDLRSKFKFGHYNHDTIGMIVIDSNGNIFAGTSTNGARHKIPGRVGDSAIVGAGAYADNEVGAAAATGDGDIMMRFLPSFLAVESLRLGQSPQEAASNAMYRIARFYPNFNGAIIVADRFGNYSAACAGIQTFPFAVASGIHEKNALIEHVKCII